MGSRLVDRGELRLQGITIGIMLLFECEKNSWFHTNL